MRPFGLSGAEKIHTDAGQKAVESMYEILQEGRACQAYFYRNAAVSEIFPSLEGRSGPQSVGGETRILASSPSLELGFLLLQKRDHSLAEILRIAEDPLAVALQIELIG